MEQPPDTELTIHLPSDRVAEFRELVRTNGGRVVDVVSINLSSIPSETSSSANARDNASRRTYRDSVLRLVDRAAKDANAVEEGDLTTRPARKLIDELRR